jgi:putative ABC transport system substrate-binding protein
MMMRKVLFALTLSTVLFAFCVPAQAQQSRIPKVGILLPGSRSTYATRIDAFLSGLRELGYTEGKTIITELRFTEGKSNRLAESAADLIRLKMDVIVTSTTPVAQAVLRLSRTIPVVMAASADPVGTGLVASLARPGGNVTGLSMLGPESDGRALELFQETVPKLTRLAFLWDPRNEGMASRLKTLEAVGQTLRVQVLSVEVSSSTELDIVFERIITNRSGGLFVPASLASVYRKHIVEFTLKKRLPAIFDDTESAETGGLMSYGVYPPAMFYRAATYVDKILKGAKPADLPVEQPTKFELVINLKTAKQIGLIIPPNVLARADRVIR